MGRGVSILLKVVSVLEVKEGLKESINVYLDEIYGPTAKFSVIAPIKCGLDGLKV